MYYVYIEAKVTLRHTYFDHFSLKCLLLVCMAAAATKSRGVRIYLISVELLFS
jgi:hypothetical protein